MDCPNCGAYNATNSIRCRRCNHLLQPEESAGSGEPEWGPASGPGDSSRSDSWEDQFREDVSRELPPEEGPPEPENPWAWTEPETSQQPEWQREPSHDYTDPLSDQPGTAQYGGPIPKGSVPNYLWPSIGATICCCAPLGIPAIVFASRVDSYLESGNRDAAEESSNKAKMWALAAFGVSILFWIAIFCTGQFSGGTTV